MLEQPDTALFTGVREFDGFAKDGVAGFVPHQDFQFCRLSHGKAASISRRRRVSGLADVNQRVGCAEQSADDRNLFTMPRDQV